MHAASPFVNERLTSAESEVTFDLHTNFFEEICFLANSARSTQASGITSLVGTTSISYNVRARTKMVIWKTHFFFFLNYLFTVLFSDKTKYTVLCPRLEPIHITCPKKLVELVLSVKLLPLTRINLSRTLKSQYCLVKFINSSLFFQNKNDCCPCHFHLYLSYKK